MLINYGYTDEELQILSELYNILPPAVKEKRIEVFSKIVKIESDAAQRALKYYKENPEQLAADIYDEFIYKMSTTKDFAPDWLTWTISELQIFINLLDDNTQEQLQTQLTQAYEDKGAIIQGDYAKSLIEYAQKTRPQAHKVITATTRRPSVFITPISKASQTLFKNDNSLYKGITKLAVEGNKKRKPITVMISLAYDNTAIKDVAPTLNSFDREVHDAIVTQYIDGKNRIITDRMIAAVLTGGDKSKKGVYPDKLLKAINDSVYKMWHTDFSIDCSQQAKFYKKLDGEILSYRGSLLYCEEVTAKLNGKITTAYHIFRPPILYKYAHGLNQVIQIDLKRLAITSLENTPENILIINYLNRRIEGYKNGDTLNIIRYERIYELLNLDKKNLKIKKLKTKQIREKVKKCLEEYINQGVIKGYEEIKEGREIAKFLIIAEKK